MTKILSGNNYAYGGWDLVIKKDCKEFINASSAKMFVKKNGKYEEVTGVKLKSGVIHIEDLNGRTNKNAIANLLVEGDNEVRVKFNNVDYPVDIVVTRISFYGVLRDIVLKK